MNNWFELRECHSWTGEGDQPMTEDAFYSWLFEDPSWHLFVQDAFVQSGFTVRYLENAWTDSCWIAHLTHTGCELAQDNAVARLQMVLMLAGNRLRLDLETFGLIYRVEDKLVVAFYYAYGCPGVLRSQPERAYGQGMLFAPVR